MRCAVFLLNGVCDKKPENRYQKPENRNQKIEDRKRMSEIRKRETENGNQISDIEAVGCHLPESE